MSTEFLELRNLSKFYGNIIALTGVTTTVNPGEVTCVLGDNGAGKSTLTTVSYTHLTLPTTPYV